VQKKGFGEEVMDREKLSLYESGRYPYCIRVRRFIEEIGATVEERNTMRNRDDFMELVQATGRSTVPCLKIESADGNVRWLHESAHIIEYLRDHFQGAPSKT